MYAPTSPLVNLNEPESKPKPVHDNSKKGLDPNLYAGYGKKFTPTRRKGPMGGGKGGRGKVAKVGEFVM